MAKKAVKESNITTKIFSDFNINHNILRTSKIIIDDRHINFIQIIYFIQITRAPLRLLEEDYSGLAVSVGYN
jgi:hypothetical protein